MKERVKIEGFVTIWQEDKNGNRTILVERKPNHFVDGGLRGLISFLIGTSLKGQTSEWSNNFRLYLGRDAATPTTHNLTALVDPIGAAPGTAPDTTSGQDRTNPATGVWKAAWVAQWSAGRVSGTVGEVALYLSPFTSLTGNWTAINTIYPQIMASRLSAADGDFVGVTIDTSKSFVVFWEIQISFA